MTISKTTPKDFFFHLGATVVLYTAVIAIMNLAFSIVDYMFPDQLAGYFYAGSIAWPISMLMILVPLLYVLEYFIIKGQNKDSGKKEIWIRKWRIYLTLFLTGAIVVGDLIALINTYLNGEISTRFVYKVLIVLFICSAVFKYYFFSVNENSRWSKMATKTIPWFGIVITLAVIIGGFIIVGSPTKQRAIRFDSQRLSDLQNIQWQIVNYWQQKETLPSALADMNDSLSGSILPTDPENKSQYVYKVIIPKPIKVSNATTTNPSFVLCASFALPTQDTEGRGQFGGGGGVMYTSKDVSYPNYGGDNDNWKHDIGQQCFTRTIDPEKYPIYKR